MKGKESFSSAHSAPPPQPSVPTICVPVCQARATDLREAVARASAVADVIELRLDYLQGDELFKALRGLPSLITASSKPIIVTLRPVNQGGQREMDDLTRIIFWVEHFLYGKPHIDFADIELDLARLFQARERDEGKELLNWDRVICSQHFFQNAPPDLNKVYDDIAATPARVMKIAINARDATDCLSVFHLLERARRESRSMIAIAMGDAGVATRILGPSRGAYMTYGALDADHETAPGQFKAAELRDVYRIQKLNAETEVVGLVGSPVAHSFSPRIHNAAFEALELNSVYIPLEVNDLASFIKRMVHPRSRELDWRLRGLSVTAPHKMAVIEHLDWCDPEAIEIGAVNTIVIEDDQLRGFNTDAAGFIAPLVESGIDLSTARCAIIGAGGAARSALWSLRNKGARLTLFARDIERAEPIAAKFGAECRELRGASFDNFDVVVNATPLGTRGALEKESPTRAEGLRGARIAYDLVYNPIETKFLREAGAAGCQTIGGLSMLIAQAAEQFKLWTNLSAPLEVMKQMLDARY